MGRPTVLKVDIVADAKGAAKGAAEAESRFSRLGGKLGQVGKVAALGLAAGLAAAGVAAFKLAQGAADDERAAALLANTLKNTAGATKQQVAATEEWITKQGQALGVADDELRPALGRLAAATGSVDKAQRLASLAMDVSAGTGKSLEAVTTALAKAQNGSVGALGKLGVATKDAAGKTLDLDTITDKLAKTYKGSASTAAETTAGKQQRLMLRLSELGETIGGYLLPVFNKLTGWLVDKVAPAAERLAGKAAKVLGPALRDVGAFIGDKLVPAFSRVVSWLVDKLVPAVIKYATPVVNGLRSAFAKVRDAVADNQPQLDKLKDILAKVGNFMADKVLPIVAKLAGKGIGTGFSLLGSIIGGVVSTIGKLVDIIDTVVKKIQGLIDWISKIKMPSLSLPNIPGLGRAAGTGMPAGGMGGAGYVSAAGAPVQFVTVEVKVDPLTDPYAVAAKIEQLLARSGRLWGVSPA